MPNFNVLIPDDLAEKIDEVLKSASPFENRSQYVRAAIREKLVRDGGA
jgi:Arc/MetJ-type ribon-helix-helix transcriptional regulator